MNILVVSDTHGQIQKAVTMYERLGQGIDIDLIIHCGDHKKDAVLMSKLCNKEVISVAGNNDGKPDGEIDLVKTPAGLILVTHGHAENVSLDNYDELIKLAKLYEAKCVCFGHTHVPLYKEIDGIILLNPGSISRPRDGSEGSVAFITADKEFNASIIPYMP